MKKDRFGISWKYELSLGIFSNLDKIDLIEVISDDYLDATKNKLNLLKTISNQVPLSFHSIQLGIASTVPVKKEIMKKLGRLMEKIQPIYWSEHLAFVRGGKIELRHLAAPPWNNKTLNGTLQNLELITKTLGSRPLVENIATLIYPPMSELTEAEWVRDVLRYGNVNMLLDLHNLYVNSVNFEFDPYAYISLIPPERIKTIHIAGGEWFVYRNNKRLLDDHLHSIPDSVFEMLTFLGSYVHNPLDIILERDGNFPEMKVLLDELERARSSLKKGRMLNHEFAKV
ncbi:MAG: DUF692 family protein [Leptospiraceae bacterium]|nr:DUF692 family protein [Leptospiraceae bacterium]